MSLSKTERLDAINIGLMLFSCVIAFIVPFELFLFSYAILGPLHYLTEISWLHDKQYYTKGRYDAIVLLVIGLVLTLTYYNNQYNWVGEETLPQSTFANLTYIAFFGTIILVFVKNNFYKIAGLVLIILSYGLSKHFALFLTVFLPTLVHVYLFTGLFMLYGALKSKSRLGIAAVIILLICPVLLAVIMPNTVFVPVTEYGRNAYVGEGSGFAGLNQITLQKLDEWFGGSNVDSSTLGRDYWLNAIFHSKSGILLMRFIAFAYTYHYLNWFSKTSIIQWHKVPKVRFALVILFWAVSVGLYVKNYTLGLQWLFFLSFLHVLLEFPLNYVSVAGIFGYFKNRITGTKEPQRAAATTAGAKR